MQMNYLIIEKKFISSNSTQKLQSFRQVKDKMQSIPSYSTIFYDRENTQSIESELTNIRSKIQFDSTINQNHYPKNNQIDSQALTYSRTASLQAIEELLPLFKKIIKLLSSKEHIASHVSHSLGVKGYKRELSTEIGKIVANSFGDYISIAETLGSKLTMEDIIDKDDKILGLNKEIASLKMENAKLFEKNTLIQQQNHRLKKKYSKLQSSSSKLQNESQCRQVVLLSNIEQQVSNVICRMDSFESEVYQQLGLLQTTLLQISNFRNDLVHAKSNDSRWKQECEKQKLRNSQLQRLLEIKQTTIENYILKQNISKNKNQEKHIQADVDKKHAEEISQQNKQLISQIIKIQQQLDQQKKLYDQMLDKNIALQKQLYFLSLKSDQEQKSSSFHIINDQGELGSFSEENALYPSAPLES